MNYKLYDNRKVNIDKDVLNKIVNKFSMINNNSGTFQIDNNKIIYDFIGKGGKGTVFSLQINDKDNNKNNGTVALKRASGNENEMLLLKLMSGYVDSQISPHFLLVYNVTSINNKNYIVMEKIDGNLNTWLEQVHSDDEWMSFLFQITMGIYVMKNYGKTYHHDLKPKNILYKNINEKDSYLEYRLNKETYYIPLFDKLFIIGDFGDGQSLLLDKNKLTSDQIKNKLQTNADFLYIQTLIKRIQVDNIIKNYNMNKLLEILKENNINYSQYYKKEKEGIDVSMKKYPQSMRDFMLLKAMAYFVIENNLYDKLVFKNKSRFILPSVKIRQMIENNYTGDKNPEQIIKEFYSSNMINKNQNIIGTFILS